MRMYETAIDGHDDVDDPRRRLYYIGRPPATVIFYRVITNIIISSN